jgi:predicted ATPase
LTLNRLPKRAIDAMIDGVIGNKPLPASIRQDIIERTDGIPLFVEEMTKAVLEAETEGEAQRTAAAIPSPASAVPPSLQASLMARLDRLGSAKEVAQIGAAIGREFSHALLAAVVRNPEVELGSALDRLVAAGLLFRQGVPPHATYLFKHALVQDVAYGTLLREPRRTLHARIAEALESRFAEIADSQPELVARHCTEAGLIEKAALLWGKAGQRSIQRSALVEAIEQITRALSQIAILPPTSALRQEEIKLQIALITPLIHVKGYAAPETRAAAERARLLIQQAREIGESPEDPLLLFQVLFSFWVANFVAFNGDVLRDLAAEFFALAERDGATAPLMIAHRLLAHSLLCTGDIAQSRAHTDQVTALYDPLEHRALATKFGSDPLVANLSYGSQALWMLGYPDAALAEAEHAIRYAREIGQSATLMVALAVAHSLRIYCRNYPVALAESDELIALADKAHVVYWKQVGTTYRLGVLSLMGKNNELDVIASAMSPSATLFTPFFSSQLAGSYSELGQFDAAWRCIEHSMTLIKTTKQRWFEAEVNRAAGEIVLKSPEPNMARAEAYFESALEVARAQQAKSWELRAAMSMARLWRDQGKLQQARELLAPVYGWFTEGFDTHDLKDAKALLEELAV